MFGQILCQHVKAKSSNVFTLYYYYYIYHIPMKNGEVIRRSNGNSPPEAGPRHTNARARMSYSNCEFRTDCRQETIAKAFPWANDQSAIDRLVKTSKMKTALVWLCTFMSIALGMLGLSKVIFNSMNPSR